MLLGARTCWQWLKILAVCCILCGCWAKRVQVPGHPVDAGWTKRVITEEELSSLAKRDPTLDLPACYDILGRLNIKARYHIRKAIENGEKLKVPNDFGSFRGWTPLPNSIREASEMPKFILIAKDVPFLGWYEKGKLVGDTPVCIGKRWDWTKAGSYKVIEKDVDHYSQSYPDESGRPTPMPWALRIYGRVWIHAGDVFTPYRSHGCINVPLEPAQALFQWAEVGTPVLVLDYLEDLQINNWARRSDASQDYTSADLPGRRP